MKETDLYLPIKVLFESLGFSVMGEVNNIDITATKDNNLVIIEMKTNFNLKLIIQAVKRQRLCEDVYIAIPRPKFKKRFGKEFNDKKHLLRRLELGLIFVTLDSKEPYAQIIFKPEKFNRNLSMSKMKVQKQAVMNEICSRNSNCNLGGTNGKIITAYKEKSILLAYLLKENGIMSTKELREASKNPKATAILYNNYYGWFDRIEKSVYKLNDKGLNELEQYKHVLDKII